MLSGICLSPSLNHVFFPGRLYSHSGQLILGGVGSHLINLNFPVLGHLSQEHSEGPELDPSLALIVHTSLNQLQLENTVL